MIEVKDLVCKYGDKEAVKGISFTIPVGQVCGYLGPNGAGKSTTVRTLAGLQRPTSGTVRLGGFDVVEQPLEVKKRIGYVPEIGGLYSTLSAREYLLLVAELYEMDPKAAEENSEKLLQLFQIADAGDRRIDTLSKGQRQKVLISAALLHDPEIILFDEPLTGLDANAARTIKTLVRGLADRGKTVLYCSHILDVVERLCDRVIILHEGRIVADDTTPNLMTHAKTLEDVFRSLTTTEDVEGLAGAFLDSVEKPKKR